MACTGRSEVGWGSCLNRDTALQGFPDRGGVSECVPLKTAFLNMAELGEGVRGGAGSEEGMKTQDDSSYLGRREAEGAMCRMQWLNSRDNLGVSWCVCLGSGSGECRGTSPGFG